jgi:predicted RNase H-like nuclease
MTAIRHRGPDLPYQLVAGVEPCRDGWLVAAGRLQGITLTVIDPEIVTTFIEVLDMKPSFSVIALHAPVGLPETSRTGGRRCDREARRLLGFPRASAIVTPPTRQWLANADGRAGLGILSPSRMKHIREVDSEIQPYWQRTVFEVNPELAFFTLNDEHPLRYAKRTHKGYEERRLLLEQKLPGVERALEARIKNVPKWLLVDAAADLMTCRRIMSRAASRIPMDPEWNEQGLRMEILR